uniref:Uncharacterized protein n=1 Tax=Laticauda laticaudata TaxID=8630 RepID=A0A8C5SFN4_LATLA
RGGKANYSMRRHEDERNLLHPARVCSSTPGRCALHSKFPHALTYQGYATRSPAAQQQPFPFGTEYHGQNISPSSLCTDSPNDNDCHDRHKMPQTATRCHPTPMLLSLM